jgi:hypothetical protein
MGHTLEILQKYLVAEAKTGTTYTFIAETYRPLYFITNDSVGVFQLRLLCDNARMTELSKAMQKELLPADSKHPIEHDALTKDGSPVLFCCLLNIPRLMKFKTGLQIHDKVGTVVAFDFQKDMLCDYLGNTANVITLCLEKIAEHLYPQSYRALRDAAP